MECVAILTGTKFSCMHDEIKQMRLDIRGGGCRAIPLKMNICSRTST